MTKHTLYATRSSHHNALRVYTSYNKKIRERTMQTEIIDIERLGTDADAVGHLNNGKTVFIPLGCPGDKVEIEITKEQDRFARGFIANIIEPSPLRVAPRCTYFEECGGCDWQHVSYDYQLKAKRQSVVDALARIGKIEHADELVSACVASKHEYNYRNKIELAAHEVGSSLEIGFNKRKSDQLIKNESCPLFAKKFEKAPKALRGSLRFLLQNKNYAPLLRIGIRAATNTSDCEVALYTPPGPFPRAQAVKIIRQALPKATSIVRVLLKGNAAERKVHKVEVLHGKGGIEEKLNGFTYHLSAPSFWQVNSRGAEVLVETVLDFLDVNGTDFVVDLYAGAGTFTLPLAARAESVAAVESYGPAVRDLRKNLERNDLYAEVIGGDAAREIAHFKHIDALVVDPPRSGLDKAVVDALLNLKGLQKIAYVSCNPSTLARDLEQLTKKYTIAQVVPVDLFPQTNHVETVVLMSRAKE